MHQHTDMVLYVKQPLMFMLTHRSTDVPASTANSLTDAMAHQSLSASPSSRDFSTLQCPLDLAEVKNTVLNPKTSVPSLTLQDISALYEAFMEDKERFPPAPVSPVKTVKPEAGAEAS